MKLQIHLESEASLDLYSTDATCQVLTNIFVNFGTKYIEDLKVGLGTNKKNQALYQLPSI